jgi:hypothetical protein
MSSDHIKPGEEPNQALLCWSEAPNFPSREEFVQVLETHLSEAVIKSTRKVDEKTKVTLIGKDYTGIGIVKSCRGEGKNYIVTIRIDEPGPRTGPAPKPDPSVLLIDEFLTEEQEAKILEELGDSMARRFAASRLTTVVRCLLRPRSWAFR